MSSDSGTRLELNMRRVKGVKRKGLPYLRRAWMVDRRAVHHALEECGVAEGSAGEVC